MNDELEMRRHKVAEMQGKNERRAFDGGLELRDAGNGKLGLVAVACRTNSEYEVGNLDRTGFIEVVQPWQFSAERSAKGPRRDPGFEPRRGRERPAPR